MYLTSTKQGFQLTDPFPGAEPNQNRAQGPKEALSVWLQDSAVTGAGMHDFTLAAWVMALAPPPSDCVHTTRCTGGTGRARPGTSVVQRADHPRTFESGQFNSGGKVVSNHTYFRA